MMETSMKDDREPSPVTETTVDLDASCEETDVKRYRKGDFLWIAQRMRDRARKVHGR